MNNEVADLRKRLVERLERLGVQERVLTGRDDGFSSLLYKGKEFAHFHDDHELDIRLTRHVIKREGLVHPIESRVHPNRSRNSQWIEIRFEKAADLERIVHFVKLALEQI